MEPPRVAILPVLEFLLDYDEDTIYDLLPSEESYDWNNGSMNAWCAASNMYKVVYITPDFDRQLLNQRGNIVILCETKNCQDKTFQDWISTKHKIDINSLKFKELEKSFYFMPKHKHFIYWAKVEERKFE